MGRANRRGHAAALGLVLAGALLASCPRVFALDPSLDISQYAHTAWKVRDGFTQGAIFSIAQTPDGYLWLGTEFGLVRFDGVRAVPWQPPAGEQLPSNYIRKLIVARDGTLWIATQKGLASWKDGKLTNYPETAGQTIAPILQDREGTVWFGTYDPGRLCAIQAGKVQCYGAGSFGQGVGDLYEDRKGNLWVSANTELWRWKPGPPVNYPLNGDFGSVALIEGNDGALLLATLKGLKQLVGRRIQDYALPGVTAQFRPIRFFNDRDGSLWISSAQGLWHLHPGRTDTFGTADGLSGDIVLSIFEDREGNVWVSTADGLDRFREYAVPRISKNQGLSSSTAYSVQATPDGTIWIGTPNGLNRWQNGLVSGYVRKTTARPSGRGDERDLNITGAVTRIENSGLTGIPESLGQGDSGRLWVSTRDGVFYLEGGRFIRVPGVAGGDMYGIVPDGRGNVWISNNREGLLQVTPGDAVRSIPWSRLGHSGYGAGALLPDRFQGGIWLGFFEGGLVYFKDGRVRASYTSADGLGDGHVNHLRFGSRGSLWAATEGGLSRIRDGHIATLTSKNGLPCNEVHWSAEDDDHFVWLNLPCGLVRIARPDLDAWVSDPHHKLELTMFDNSDGVRSIGVQGGYGPPVTKAPDGKLWFADRDSVSVIDPRHLPVNKLPPPVHVEQITANHNIYWQNSSGDRSASVRLPAQIRDLEIDYTALSFVAPEKVHFRYKLEGWDRDWQWVGNRRQAFYTNLSPGNYRFRVAAGNNSGVWNEAGTSLDFSIAPAYYQTTWFRLSCVAAFLALLWALHRLRLRQLQREFEAGLEGRVGERTRIARELHDTLLQSFQGLLLHLQAGVNLLATRPHDAKQKLENAIDMASDAITEGRRAVQDLRSSTMVTNDIALAVDTFGQELAGNEMHENSPAFRVDVEGTPRDLHPIMRDEVCRIACEALRNAFRHAQASRIEVEIHYDAQELRLRIRDDGKGIEPKLVDGNAKAGHWGLNGMRERAKLIGGNLELWSNVQSGTEIELTIPAAAAYAKSTAQRRSWFSRKGAGVN